MSLKKMMALGCAVVLTVAALAACSSTEEEPTEATEAVTEEVTEDVAEEAVEGVSEEASEEAATLVAEADAE